MERKMILSHAMMWAATLAVILCLYPTAVGGQLEGGANAGDPPAKPADVPVKAVVLFSSGVGYFEHFGTVNGSGSTELRFKTQQINDILKSLILQDLDGGKITTITYPSQDPIAKTLRSFQVDITSNPSLGELLNQLRGAKVKVTLGVESADGTILGLEKKSKPVEGKGIAEVWVLNLLSGATIRSVQLDLVTKLELEDKQLQEELAKALLALSQARDQDKKPVTVNFTGQGERHVRLGYVVETPVWKTSYRLVLSDAAQDQGKDEKDAKPQPVKGGSVIQGWAIVENQTDNDWNEVQLSLVSGRPISFIQDLYRPLYVPRPVVQPKLYASLTPQTYEGGMDKAKQMEGFEEAHAMRMPASPAAKPRALDAVRRKSVAGRVSERELQVEDLLSDAIDPTASVASVASAAKAGELFQYTVGSVSLPRQRSAMIPIIADAIEAEKVSIYNQSVLARNPLNGARLKNTTGKHLLAGPVTVLDAGANMTSYAGDASIDDVPPGQERLVSYGIDLQVLVDATKNTNDSQIQSGRIIKGVLTITRKNVFSQDYLAENKGDKDKSLIIEHPLRQGWKLVSKEKPLETTETLYRFKGHVAPGKGTKLTVKEEVVQAEEIAILPTDLGQLDWYSKQGEIPKTVREVLSKAAGMKGAMLETERQIASTQQRLAEITAEQDRLRQNLKTVAANSTYATRLLTKLNDQETQIEKLQGQVEDLTQTLKKQTKELEDYLGNLPVE